ncbi:MAG: ParB/RepB/Spo0J family partition protein [Salinisphaeraceae bacterium]|nr:ParB/RepB/Spo0J family partition protein [Salinisphaeraceae bacterium]
MPASAAHATTRSEPQIQRIAVDLIHPGEYQARRRFDQGALEELAASVAESGIVQPVVVRSHNGGYELLAGERRWRAAQIAGLHDIPAIVRDDLDDKEAHVLGLIENLQRESLAPMETSRGLKELSELFELTHEATALRIGKSRAYVSNFLRLLNLDERVQSLLDEERISMGHARVLAGLPRAQQMPLASEALKRRWSVRALEAAGRRLQAVNNGPAGPITADDRAARRELEELQRLISERLGNSVNVRHDKQTGGGEIRIRYHSLDEFEGLLEKWGVDYKS